MVRIHVAIVLAAVLAQAAGHEGTVTGTMTFNGVIVPIRHVYASAQPGFFDKKKDDIHVLFSDAPLDDAARPDTFALMKLASEGHAHILEVVVDAAGDPISGSIYVPEVEGMVSASGMHKFAKETLSARTIAGKLSADGPHTFMGLTWEYTATFSAPIPRPPTPAELAAALASPPAVAASRYVAAIRAGQLAPFLSMMTAAAAADYRGADGAAKLQQFKTDMPPDSRVVSLIAQTDGAVLAQVEGHEGKVVIGYTFRMVLDAGMWKVGQ